MRNIVVLGSTGSIGEQTLDVAGAFPDQLRVVGLSARRNSVRLAQQMAMFDVKRGVLTDGVPDSDMGIERGEEALTELVTDSNVDLVVVALVGAAGLVPTLRALEAGKLVALANKETLVMAGPVIRQQLALSGGLVPIDSEHSAIWQCIQGEPSNAIERLILTASGGAFRDLHQEELESVTPSQALQHPTWRMGPKVTVDSATLMNKGLEVIEATLLFDVPIDMVEVVMHRESIVHSLVYFKDSSVKAQLGIPDMRVPIEYALSCPERWHNSLDRLDLPSVGALSFSPVDWNRYPCLTLAIEAGKLGGTYPTALCSADEVAVEEFLANNIRFDDIPRLVERTLERHASCQSPTLEDILHADALARETSRSLAAQLQ